MTRLAVLVVLCLVGAVARADSFGSAGWTQTGSGYDFSCGKGIEFSTGTWWQLDEVTAYIFQEAGELDYAVPFVMDINSGMVVWQGYRSIIMDTGENVASFLWGDPGPVLQPGSFAVGVLMASGHSGTATLDYHIQDFGWSWTTDCSNTGVPSGAGWGGTNEMPNIVVDWHEFTDFPGGGGGGGGGSGSTGPWGWLVLGSLLVCGWLIFGGVASA